MPINADAWRYRKNLRVTLREKECSCYVTRKRENLRVMLREKDYPCDVTRERMLTLCYARENLRVMLCETESLRYGKSRLLERCFEIKS